MFLPENKTYVWVCTKCDWQLDVGRSDALMGVDKCPECGAETQLTTQDAGLLDIVKQIIKIK